MAVPGGDNVKRFFLVLILIIVALSWIFFALHRVWRVPGAKLVTHGHARTLTPQELGALRNQPGAGALPGSTPHNPSTGLPSDVQNSLDTVNQVQKINEMNRKQSK